MADNQFLISARLQLIDFKKDADKLVAEVHQVKKKVENLTKNTKIPIDTAEASTETKKLIDNFKSMGLNANDAKQAINELNKGIKGTSNNIQDVGRRVFVWGALSAAIFGALQNLRQLFDVTVKINTEIGQLRKILPEGADLNFVKGQAFDFAIEFGQAPVAVLDVFKQFAQAGLEVKESLDATRAALLAMNVTGASTQEAFNALIGAARIFNIEFSELESVIDKVQAVEKSSAVNTRDLIESITAIGPGIRVFRGDIDDLFGLISALTESARISGKEASNTLKAVLAGLISPETIVALQRIGINVMQTADSFRPVTDIFADLAKKLKELQDQGREAELFPALVSLAEQRQFSKFIALLQNYDRAIEGIKISQNSFNEAIDANRVVMDTYEKRVAKVNARLEQLAETVFTSGITQIFLDFKIALNAFLTVLQAIPGPVLSSLAIFGAFSLALKGLKAALFGFTGPLATTLRGLSTASLVRGTTQITEKVAGFGGAVTKTNLELKELGVTMGQRALIGVTAGLGLFLLWTTAVNALRKSTSSVNRVLDESRQKFKSFSESLRDVSFAGQEISLSVKTKQVLDIFNEAFIKSGNLNKNVDLLRNKMSLLLTGVPSKNLTLEQFQSLSIEIEKIGKQIQGIASTALFARFNVLIAEGLRPVIEDLKKVESGFTGFLSGGLSTFVRFLSARFGFDDTNQAALDFQEILEGAVIKLRDLNTEAEKTKEALDFGDIRFGESRIPSPEEFGFIGPPAPRDLLVDPTLASKKLENFNKTVKNTVDSVLKLPSIQKVISQSFGDVGDIFGTEVQDSTEKTKLFNAVLAELAKRLEESLGRGLKAPDLVILSKLLAQIKSDGEEASKGIALIDFSISSFLAAIKRSALTVVSDFTEQLRVIDQVSSAHKDLGVAYKTNAEVVKLSSSALDEFVRRNTENVSKLSDLENQLRAATIQFNKFQKTKGKPILDEGESAAFEQSVDEISNRINKINQELDTQRIIVAQEKLVFDEILKIYIQINEAAKESEEVEKRKVLLINSQTDQLVNYKKFLIDINKIRINNPFDRVGENEKLFKDILDIQLQEISLLERTNELDEVSARTKRQELILTSQVEESNRRMEIVLDRIDDLYKDINDDVDSMADSVAGLLSDQEKFFNLLSGEQSFIEFLGAGLEDITKVLSERDAQLIAESIKNPIRDALIREKEELKVLLEKTQDPNLFIIAQEKAFPGLEMSIQSAHEIGGELAGLKIIELIQSTFIPQLEAIKEDLKFPESIAGGSPVETAIRDNISALKENTATLKGEEFIPSVASISSPSFSSPAKSDLRALALLERNQGVLEEKQLLVLKSMARDFSSFDLIEAELRSIEQSTSIFSGEFDQIQSIRNKEMVGALTRRLGIMLGQFIGASIAQAGGRDLSGVTIGGTIGGIAGGAIGGPTGAAVGQILGSVVGGLFGGKEEDEKQTKELIQIQENTAQLVDRLSPEIFNAPASFNLPSGQSLRGGVNVNIGNINVSGGSSQDVARELSIAIEQSINRTFSRRSTFD